MSQKKIQIKLASNHYAFHWSFPEIVADSRGYFAQNNVEIIWTDVTPQNSVNKSEMYVDILDRGIADLYHAADWVCIDRTTRSRTGWMVAKSPAGRDTLNSSFTLFAGLDSGINNPAVLAGHPIAVDTGTGSYYTAMQDLERFVPRERIKLVQEGEPSQRLVALLEGKVSGASLLSPWSDIAKVLGLKEILKTSRNGSTVLVARRSLPKEALKPFLGAVNSAIRLIDEDPDSYRNEYFTHIEEILRKMPQEVTDAAETLRYSINIPSWAPWEKFTEEDFQKAYSWMLERGLAEQGLTFSDLSMPDLEI